uniref:Cytochrome P450 2C31-like n=1 Tax=Xenopus tropicalis TaxID=8364 RepID=A0A803K6G8_XENTR
MDVLSGLTLFLIFLLTLLFLSALWKQQKRSSVLPPGPTPIPLLGTPRYVTFNIICKHFPKLQEKYGNVFTIWQLGDPIVILCGYKMVKEALINHAEEFSQRPTLPLGDELTKGYNFQSFTTHWRHFRRFILTTLRNIGVGKAPVEERSFMEAQQLIEAMSQMEGKPFNPIGLLGCAVFNMMSFVLFGKRFDYKDKKLHDLISNTRNHINNVLSRTSQIINTFPIILKFPFLWKMHCKDTLCLQSFVEEQIQSHKENRDKPRDFIDFFLQKIKKEEGNGDSIFCDTSLHMFITGLLAAGTDTTTSTLKYCLARIAQFPEIQAKVQQEIDDVTGSQRPPGLSDRPHLPYTNAVIHELQRHLDLAPTGFYHALSKDTEFQGFTLHKGTRVIPYLSSVLFDPTQWETPDEFNPGHFLDEKGQFRAKPAFMAFSAGKRECLGVSLARMEIFLFFSALLQKFTFCPTTGQRLSPRPPIPTKFHFILTSQIKAVLRSSKAA